MPVTPSWLWWRSCQRRFTSTWFFTGKSSFGLYRVAHLKGTASVCGELNVKGSTIRNTLSIKCSTEHRIIVSITQEDFPFRNCVTPSFRECFILQREPFHSRLSFSACRISSLFFPYLRNPNLKVWDTIGCDSTDFFTCPKFSLLIQWINRFYS